MVRPDTKNMQKRTGQHIIRSGRYPCIYTGGSRTHQPPNPKHMHVSSTNFLHFGEPAYLCALIGAGETRVVMRKMRLRNLYLFHIRSRTEPPLRKYHLEMSAKKYLVLLSVYPFWVYSGDKTRGSYFKSLVRLP